MKRLPRQLSLLAISLNLLSFLAFANFGYATTAGESEVVQKPHIEVSLVSEFSRIAPGQPFWAALRLVPEAGWHTYWRNPGDTGLPTRIEWTLPAGSEAGEIQWPIPERIDYLGLINYGFHGDTLLLTRITPPVDLPTDQPYRINAVAKWLVCADICIPGETTLALELPVGNVPIASPAATSLAAALAALPRHIKAPTATYSVADEFAFDLGFASGTLEQATDMQFFPVAAELIRNEVAPKITRSGDRLQVRVTKDPYVEQPPEEFPVLITFMRDTTPVAYQFTADNVAAAGVVAPTAAAAALNGYSLFTILVFALAGGLVLNLMPCVFPVLSIKVLSLMESGNHSRRNQQLHGLAYTVGVVLSFVFIAAILLIIRAAGEGVGWGFQLQSPWFVAGLAYLFFVLGLGMAGFVEIGASLTRAGNLMGGHGGLAGSFLTGVLATVVATPCTAPFMGTAMGFAMTQSAGLALLVFAMLGLGLALPFLLLTFVPALANRLPRPGRWMKTLKEFLSFPLFLTAVWLLWVLANQTNSDMVALVLGGMVILAFALWLWRNSAAQDSAPIKRSLALVAIAAALALLTQVEQPSTQQGIGEATQSELSELPWSEQRLQDSLQAGHPVFVNFTADWCITCKVNERVALNSSELIETFNREQVTYLVGDWTSGNEVITRVLERFGRSGVPLYLMYLPGRQEPEILPQLLTPATLIDALQDSEV